MREKRVRVAVSICTCQNPFLTFYKGEISMGNKLKTVDAETLLSTPMSAPLGEALRCPVAIGATMKAGR